MRKTLFILGKKHGVMFVMGVLFSLSYMQMPLFSSNQNSYFLHGLADAGYGFLNRDWLARTTNHIPLFSLVIKTTFTGATPSLIYLFHGILVFIYFISLIGILNLLFNLQDKKTPFLLCLLVLFFIHNSPIHYLTGNRLPVLNTLPREMLLFTEGLAGQYILGPYFQPSAFGIFLLLSLFLFLQKKEIPAMVAAVIAASFHPSYLLQTFLMITVFFIIVMKDKRFKQGFLIAGLALLFLLPSLVYMYLNFKPSNPDLFQESQSILINYRLAHHVKPRYWFHVRACVQIVVMILGILISRRNHKLFPVMMFLGLSSFILTIIQLLTRNRTLALMFPWRTSVILVPVSVILLVGWIVERLSSRLKLEKLRQSYHIVAGLVIFVPILYVSGLGLRTTLQKVRGNRPLSVSKYVKATAREQDIYLVPMNWEWFRLQSGAPIFVDGKSHPYKDSDVIEWRKRTNLAHDFYQSKDARGAEYNMNRILTSYAISRIIVENNFPDLSTVSRCNILYKGDWFCIYKVDQ
ncbi:hypothetical protein JW926_18135 [Candidatus Sumerlaeota bacterium]|nr:hypothetical protein [Candidatus Sumerlaeota bacterium]